MPRLAPGAVVNLVPAGRAVDDHHGVGGCLAHRRQQRQFAHRKRHVDGIGAIAERTRHSAAAGLDCEVVARA
jgi:hypothetical protein